MLTKEQIDALASGKGVKRIAVENFLGSLGCSDKMGASMNLHADAKCYGWNAATVNAIRRGISLL
jgi:hypothetical protein